MVSISVDDIKECVGKASRVHTILKKFENG